MQVVKTKYKSLKATLCTAGVVGFFGLVWLLGSISVHHPRVAWMFVGLVVTLFLIFIWIVFRAMFED